MTWNVRKLISFPFQRISITNRVFSLFDCFTTYYNCMTWNFKILISPPFQFTSITSRVLTLFDRFTTSYNCMTWNVRKLISFHHFSALVSQIVFLAYLTVLRAYYNPVWPEISEILISPPFQFTSITKSCSYLIWPFYDFLQLYDLKCQKTHVSTISVHKYHKSCSSHIWPFYSLLQPFDLKSQKTHISAISVHKYHKAFS